MGLDLLFGVECDSWVLFVRGWVCMYGQGVGYSLLFMLFWGKEKNSHSQCEGSGSVVSLSRVGGIVDETSVRRSSFQWVIMFENGGVLGDRDGRVKPCSAG